MNKNEVLFTSITYDKGWEILIDGKRADYSSISDSLICLNVPEGTHTIEFKFVPQGLKLGVIISCGSLISIILYLIIKNKLIKLTRVKPKEEFDFNDKQINYYSVIEDKKTQE